MVVEGTEELESQEDHLACRNFLHIGWEREKKLSHKGVY